MTVRDMRSDIIRAKVNANAPNARLGGTVHAISTLKAEVDDGIDL